MDELASTEFRKTYATLAEPTVVTVNGHAIGIWLPANREIEREFQITHQRLPFTTTNAHDTPEQIRAAGGLQARQSRRDDLLRKINRSK